MKRKIPYCELLANYRAELTPIEIDIAFEDLFGDRNNEDEVRLVALYKKYGEMV